MLAGYLESLGLKIHLSSFQRKNFQTHLWSASQSHNWYKASSLNYTPRKTAPAYKYSLPDMQQLAKQVTNDPKCKGLKPATDDTGDKIQERVKQ